jgi:hypothetical protein
VRRMNDHDDAPAMGVVRCRSLDSRVYANPGNVENACQGQFFSLVHTRRVLTSGEQNKCRQRAILLLKPFE